MRGQSALASLPAHLRPGTPQRLAHLYDEHVRKQCREERILIALSFLVTFGMVRFITHSIKDHRFTWLFHNMSSGGGTHIHHLVFGIIGLMVVGYISIGFNPQRPGVRRLLAVLFGLSAALTMDEFALWLRLSDVYWTSEGRQSVDAAFVFGALAIVGVAGRGFFAAIAKDTAELLRDLTRR
jgi:hypothetical protein